VTAVLVRSDEPLLLSEAKLCTAEVEADGARRFSGAVPRGVT
jgi:hypothetical protein